MINHLQFFTVNDKVVNGFLLSFILFVKIPDR